MIDIISIFLMNIMSKIDISTNIFNYELLTILIIINIANNNNNLLYKFYKFTYNKFKINYTMLEINGWESLNDGLYTFEYPQNMTAINYYVYSTGKSNNFRYFNNKRNGLYFADAIKDIIDTDESPNYILGDVLDIKIDDDIYISVITDDTNNNIDKKTILNWKICMRIYSYNHDTQYIQQFINRCISKYEQYLTNKNKNKIYHFIYQGKKNNKLLFSSKVISDLNNPELQNHETFENIFHKNKEQIINDIDKLHDINYYKKTGLKRKKGYMFYGLPGTGKTTTVMAMSNYDKRHIIEVPFNRVQTNNELEAILNISCINSIEFRQDNIIILFDELDIQTKSKTENIIIEQNNTKKKIYYNTVENDSEEELKKNNDKLNLSTLLSRFDGIGNYAGLIIVATTNNINNVDNALYRDGRLNLIHFDNATIIDIQNIIEKYYECKLGEDLLDQIKLLDKKISHAKIRCKLEYNSTPELLIEQLII